MKRMPRQTSLYGIFVVVGIFQTSVQSLKFYQNGNFECKKNGTLTCKSEMFPINSALDINGLKIVICVSGQCIVNPLTPNIYVIEHDYSKGVINVTVLSVSTNISNTFFRCDGDSTFLTIGPSIAVTVTPSTLFIDVIQETENTTIQAVTGCAKPSSIVNFKWFMSKDNTSNGEIMLETIYNPLQTENDTYCQKESYCNGTGIASTITFPTPAKDNREAYYVHCIVYVNDNHIVAKRTTRLIWLPSKMECNKWWCLSCGFYGAVVAAISLAALILAGLMKVFSYGKIGGLQCWELFAITGACADVICLIVIIVVAYVCKDCNNTKRSSVDCWIIYIIILGIFVVCALGCMLFYITKEGVEGLKIISRKGSDKTMTIKLEWKSRLHKWKTFHMVLNNEKESAKLDYTQRKDGVLEVQLTDMKLDSDYIAHVYSKMCVMQSVRNQIEFNTKGRPLPPYSFYEDETRRTESSVTLTWKQAKGPAPQFIIKYQRSKGKNRVWMCTEKIWGTNYTIDGLKPGTSYTLIINAINDLGSSDDSEPLPVQTRALAPIPPKDFRCISVKESEVILSWKPYKNIKKQEFLLTIYNMSEENKPCKKRHDTEIRISYTGKKVMTHKVKDLKPGSKYQFEIFTSAGKLISERSAITSVETEDHDDIGEDTLSSSKRSITTSVFHMTDT